MSERFTHVHGYCCRDQAATNVGKIRFTRMADVILIFPFFLNNEERNVLGMEETRFKTDHSQHCNDEKPTGRLRIYATKINFYLP